MKKLCLRCMHELDSNEKCPNCHFDINEYKPKTYYLPTKTVLAGKYLVGCVLGEGGFGITYIGWDLTLDLMVAIKEYYPFGFVARDSSKTLHVEKIPSNDNSFFDRGREKFKNEAQKLAKFYGDPGIVSVMATFQENDTAYIVMEYIQGIHLADFTKHNGGILGIDTALELLRQPMQSLSQLHDRGMLHRDISPENLMVTQKNTVKLIDFGSAGAAASDQKTRNLAVRPGYSPFELYFAEGKEGPFSDEYSLCATIYKTITGVIPPDAPSRIRTDSIKRPSELGVKIAPNQERALMKGLSVNAKDRFQTIAELNNALANKNVSASKKPGRLTAAFAILACIALLLLTGFVGYNHMQKFGAIDFSDIIFEHKLRDALSVSANDDISRGDLDEITKLTIDAEGVYFDDVETQPGRAHWGSLMLSDIEYFPNLVYLSVTSADLIDIEALASMKHLKTLILTDCSLSNISGLQDMPVLSNLDVSVNPINDISQLSGLPLASLDISDTNVESLEPLANMDSLKQLSINRCPIRDISPLSGISGLTALYAADTSVRDWTGLPKNVDVYGVWAEFKSPDFEAMLRTALGKAEGESVAPSEIEDVSIITIDCGVLSFEAPSGISCPEALSFGIYASDLLMFPNLEKLTINGHIILDSDEMSALTGLSYLVLSKCGIPDYGFLASLSGLKELFLYNNDIRDIGPIAALELTTFGINTEIDSLEPLADLSKLNWLYMSGCGISDISPLSALTGMKQLYLQRNRITSLEPLRSMNLQILDVSYNPVESLEPLSGMQELTTLNISNCGITDLTPLSGLGALTDVNVQGNSIADFSPVSHVENVTGMDEQKALSFASPEFEAMLRTALGKAEGEIIVPGDVFNITTVTIINGVLSFELPDNVSVQNDFGFDINTADLLMFPNLDRLVIAGHTISGTEELSLLTGLSYLYLNKCGITDCGFVTALPELKSLFIYNNDIRDIGPVAGLDLIHFGINTPIESLMPLAGMYDLDWLYLINCELSDISPIAALTKIRTLYLNTNNISSLEPLRSMNLQILDVSYNPVESLEPLSGMQELETLKIHNCGITDLSPLSGLGALTELYAQGNSITDWSPVEHVEKIEGRMEQVLKFQSKEFETMLRKTLGKEEGEAILSSDTEGISTLTIVNGEVIFEIPGNVNTPEDFYSEIDASDLLKFPNLTTLIITGHTIANIDELSLLTGLTYLSFKKCGITDCGFVSALPELKSLFIYNNDIRDIGPVAGLDLIHFGINTPIESLMPLVNMNSLSWLALINSGLSDISPLIALTNIRTLYIGSNQITSIEPLKNMKLKMLDISNNPIESLEPLSGMQELASLTITNCGITDLSPLSGLAALKGLNVQGNSITDWSPVEHVENISGMDEQQTLSFASPEFEAMLRTALGKAEGEPIVPSEIADISTLTIKSGVMSFETLDSISEPDEMSFTIYVSDLLLFPNLKKLTINGHVISDGDGMSALTGLTYLCLSKCGITNFWFAASLTELKNLYIYYCDVSDIEPIAGLDLSGFGINSYIDSLDPLINMTELEYLFLPNCGIDDIWQLSTLPNLINLNLFINNISDLSPISGLTKLKKLIISGNNISSLDSLRGLQLEELWIYDNPIESLEPLADMDTLEILRAAGLDVDWSYVSHVEEVYK